MPRPLDFFRPTAPNSHRENLPQVNPNRRLLLMSTFTLPVLKIFSSLKPPQGALPTNLPPHNTDNTPSSELSAEQLLENFLASIAKAQANALAITSQKTYFDRFNISPEAQQKDLELFFRLYRAAERKYKVPWEYLWIMHVHESTASRHPNPGINGYIGAMQRSRESYPDSRAIQAATGWEFLSKAPQRYTPPQFPTYDFQEIFFAAWKLRRDANKILQNNDVTDLQALEEAQFSYCASENAVLRIQDLHIIREDLLRWELLNKFS